MKHQDKTKIFLSFLIIFIVFNNVQSQNLNLNELLQIRKMKIGSAEEYLTSKKWEYAEGNQGTDDERGEAMFRTIGSSLIINFGKNRDNSISIVTVKKEKYLEYLTSVKKTGANLIETKLNGSQIEKSYQNSKYTFTFLNDNSTTYGGPTWMLFIKTNDDYEKLKLIN